MCLRVLHFVGSMDCGGQETMIMNFYRNIDRSKVQFDFVVNDGGPYFYEEEIKTLGGNMHRVAPKGRTFVKNLLSIKKVIADGGYNIVHLHTSHAISVINLLLFRLAGVKVIIAHSHTNFGTHVFIHRMIRPLIKYVANHYFACSDEAGTWLFGKQLADLKILKNSIDSQHFTYSEQKRKEIRQKLGIDSKFVVGHIGRLTRAKNHFFILETFKEIYNKNNNAILLLCGEGELKEQLLEKTEQLGLARAVFFLGLRSDTAELLQSMDVFLFPSLYEGLGIAAIEAQAAGLKVIASENVPRIVKITNLVDFISLKQPPETWADAAIRAIGRERPNTHEDIVKAGYDVKDSATWLENFYITANSN
ncbi:glycosyltransferase family 1 protein [Paenibacillus methanolicus]|uniref:Glycosyltransferase involved in cell wall biosynthesis n=1 Tax=Paenibacillus methanolicus TaxID=582686 RepID=A0A5S5C8P5_9BACL|nr:glycosyltransferase family 1 protein [Paenibacillus methanolicus]TYP75667.1 glycosyltransferase involved in cell wall biosynthesis [Paenibacillus methanolicus]